MKICLSILEFERELSRNVENIKNSQHLALVKELVDSDMIYRLHLDVMRPSLIPNRTVYSSELLEALYLSLSGMVLLEFHLMAKNPHESIVDGKSTHNPTPYPMSFTWLIEVERSFSEVKASSICLLTTAHSLSDETIL